ncbi:FG-GAP repeat domain-containing protein [Algicola sagamiensis]|uniref:FG-GAP repeat domain-containing protein n=1 Tax=Algicola sagamiensis TaxID=163869 RepID=UPI00036D0D1B|nr:VCBS repeat-containing protein [Algicola sagamiensis]
MKRITLNSIACSLLFSAHVFSSQALAVSQDDPCLEKSPPPKHHHKGFGVRFADVNGDGAQDLIKWNHNAASKTFLGRGDGSFADEGLAHKVVGLPKHSRRSAHFVDVTSDNRADKVVHVIAKRPKDDDPRCLNQAERKDKDDRPYIELLLIYVGLEDGRFAEAPLGDSPEE